MRSGPRYGLCACFFVFAIFFLPVGTHALADHLVISELIVDVSASEASGEFVEIYNPTCDVVDISRWDIAYMTATSSTWKVVASIPNNTSIQPFSYYLIGGGGVSPEPDYVDSKLGFSSTSGNVALRDNGNDFIDILSYGDVPGRSSRLSFGSQGNGRR